MADQGIAILSIKSIGYHGQCSNISHSEPFRGEVGKGIEKSDDDIF